MNALYDVDTAGLDEVVKEARRRDLWHITLEMFAEACGMPDDSRQRLELDQPNLWRLGFLEFRPRKIVDELFYDWRTFRENSGVTHWLNFVGVGEYFVMVPNQRKNLWAVLLYDSSAGLERKVMFDAEDYSGIETPAHSCVARVTGCLRPSYVGDRHACSQFHGNDADLGGRYLWCQCEQVAGSAPRKLFQPSRKRRTPYPNPAL